MIRIDKKVELEKLYDDYRRRYDDREIVTGDGNTDAVLLLVGEAPGKDEIKLGKPFVGMAGKNLNEFLSHIKLEREAIYITNAIKYKLSKLNEKTGRTVNRPATKDEIIADREFLLKEIGVVKPKVIVTLGNVPLRAITGEMNLNIGETHGETRTISLIDKEYKLFPLYHPASVIYNQKLKEVYLSDLNKLRFVCDAIVK